MASPPLLPSSSQSSHALTTSCPPEAFGSGTLNNNSKHHRMITFKEHRGSSPNPDFKDLHVRRPTDIPEVLVFDEGNDLMRSCVLLSSAMGIHKSFSTSDISQLPNPDTFLPSPHQLTAAMSELALNSLQRYGYMLDSPRLDHASRSCSTWVAVGELASTSQLPSPHGGPANQLSSGCTPPPPAFTAADLIRSVNKKVRQNYVRRRLLTTYRAYERLSQSEFNLDRLEAAAEAAAAMIGPGPTELLVPALLTATTPSTDAPPANVPPADASVGPPPPVAGASVLLVTKAAQSGGHKSLSAAASKEQIDAAKLKITQSIQKNVTVHDIEKERGKPLTKYDRNMMIFNWLHTLEEAPSDDDKTDSLSIS